MKSTFRTSRLHILAFLCDILTRVLLKWSVTYFQLWLLFMHDIFRNVDDAAEKAKQQNKRKCGSQLRGERIQKRIWELLELNLNGWRVHIWSQQYHDCCVDVTLQRQETRLRVYWVGQHIWCIRNCSRPIRCGGSRLLNNSKHVFCLLRRMILMVVLWRCSGGGDVDYDGDGCWNESDGWSSSAMAVRRRQI